MSEPRCTVPWIPALVCHRQREFPGLLVLILFSVRRVAEKVPGAPFFAMVDVMFSTNPYSLSWENCAEVVELALELGIVEALAAAPRRAAGRGAHPHSD